jgi:hypothetical protein
MALNVTGNLVYYDSLGGYNSIDITDRIVSVESTRGKSRQLDYYEPGSLNVTLKNFDRAFDPTNTSSDYQAWVRPKVVVGISGSGGKGIFGGLIDDWSFTYDVNGEAFASFSATDYTGILSSQYMAAQSFPAELSGARVNRVLDDPGVSWSTGYGDRIIDTGTQLLAAETIANNTNALDYLRQIETSEQGAVFGWTGDSIVFKDNNHSINSTTGYELFADDGTINYTFGTAGKPSIKYELIDVSYTSQLLYNSIFVNSYDGVNYVIATDPTSIALYSPNQLNIDGVLYSSSTKLSNLAGLLIRKYSNPEYRINSIRINVYPLDSTTQNDLASIELNDYAKVRFKPNGIGSTIERYVQIIGIDNEITPGSHYLTLQFDSVRVSYLVLDDTEFGKLDSYVLRL